MSRTLFLTVVDSNPVNHLALKLLFKSINVNFPSILENMIVLYPEGELSQDIIAWLSSAVRTCALSLNFQHDKYRAKFLLSRFIRTHTVSADAIFYLDPDHLIFEDLILVPQSRTLLVSSEVRALTHELHQHFLDEYHIDMKHYNTSIIYGCLDSWEKAIELWESIYCEIELYTTERFREEIAFASAALKKNIYILPCSTAFQGNFCYPLINTCSLFHYGGDFEQAIAIKDALTDRDLSQRMVQTFIDCGNYHVTQKIRKLIKG